MLKVLYFGVSMGKILIEKSNCKKSRYENRKISNSVGTNNYVKVLKNLFVVIETIIINLGKISSLMEESERDRERNINI
ncbi:hypothetical protein CR513_34072, partial [Mucuna pruriens]